MPKSKTIPFYGIVAVGNTKADAINNYKLAALGRGVKVFVDEGQSLSFVSNAHSDLHELFNPQSGDLDLVERVDLLKSLSFQSEASDEQLEVNYLQCVSGCGSHVVFDSEELVQHCPVCTSQLSESNDIDEDGDEDQDTLEDDKLSDLDDLESEPEDSEDLGDEDALEDDFESKSTDDEDVDDLSDLEDEDVDDLSDLEDEDLSDLGSESADDEDLDALENDDLESDDLESDDLESDDLESESNEGEDADVDLEDQDDLDVDYDSEDTSDNGEEPLVVASDSLRKASSIYLREKLRYGVVTASDEQLEVNYVVCSSAECGAHILSDEEINECPVCYSQCFEPNTGELTEQYALSMDVEDEDTSDLSLLGDGEDDEDTDDLESESNEDELDDLEDDLEDDSSELVEEDPLNNLSDDVQESRFLDVAYSASIQGEPRWTAYYKGVPIAMLSKSNAGKNAEIFDQPALGHAVIAGAAVAGNKTILKEMGFEPIRHKVAVSSFIQREVEAQVAEAKANLDNEKTEYSQRLMSALATAAIGINRGFFAGIKNPVKDRLMDALSAAGIKNADVLVNNAFRESSDAYHRELFAKANDILEKPADVQESLSRAVLETAYMPSVSSASLSIEDRLASIGTTVEQQTQQQIKQPTAEPSESSAITDTKIKSVVASLGRRF